MRWATTPSHATKPGKRFRYYVTRSDQLGDAAAWRVSAHDLGRLVCDRLSELLTDRQLLCDLASDAAAVVIPQFVAKADLAAATLRSGPAKDRAILLAAMVTRIDLRVKRLIAPSIHHVLLKGSESTPASR